jgi:hypothetical protein
VKKDVGGGRMLLRFDSLSGAATAMGQLGTIPGRDDVIFETAWLCFFVSSEYYLKHVDETATDWAACEGQAKLHALLPMPIELLVADHPTIAIDIRDEVGAFIDRVFSYCKIEIIEIDGNRITMRAELDSVRKCARLVGEKIRAHQDHMVHEPSSTHALFLADRVSGPELVSD